MFKEQKLPIRKITKLADGIDMILTASDNSQEASLPRKLAIKLGIQKDELESPNRNVRKQMEGIRDEVYEKFFDDEQKKAMKGSGRVDINPQVAALIMAEIGKRHEALLDSTDEMKVKILEKPLKEDDFGDFEVPASAWALIRPIFDFSG